MKGRLFLMGSIAAFAYTLYYFRGDLQRYAKMKMM